MDRIARSLYIILLLAFPSGQTAFASPRSIKEIQRYFGSWVIASYESKGYSLGLTEEFAKSQIGKRMQLGSKRASFEKGFLWLSEKNCNDPKYRWLKEDDFIGHAHQALLPDEHPKARPGHSLFFDVACGSTGMAGFEVSNLGELVAYYDGYYFFLRKVQ